MRELFIYYRIQLDQIDAAQAAVVAMQAALTETHVQVRARMLFRPDVQDGLQTWMETYSTDRMQDPHGISLELQAEIESRAAVLAPFIHGARHVEVFHACAL
jgi:Domain of unknown function (DUF4936)